MNLKTHNVTINGEAKSFPPECTLTELLKTLELSDRGIAIEVDDNLIPHDQFKSFLIDDGSRIEIVSFVGGG